jgi:hypothetical protein
VLSGEPERHRLFYLLYQVEIRQRQPIKKLSRQQPPTPALVSCNYGNQMVDRLHPAMAAPAASAAI